MYVVVAGIVADGQYQVALHRRFSEVIVHLFGVDDSICSFSVVILTD